MSERSRRTLSPSLPPSPSQSPAPERGSALLIVILALLIVTTIGLSTSQVASTEVDVAANYQQSWAAFYAADGAAQASFGELIRVAQSLGRFPEQDELDSMSIAPVHGASISEYAMMPVADAVQEPLSSGFYQGMVALSRPYEVALTAETDAYPVARASVSLGMQVDIIPIFQFAVFYEDDLELLPGPPMTLSGRVHSNSDIYLGAESSLTIDSNLTSAGDLFHRRKDTTGTPGGGVYLRDGTGAYPEMDGLDSRDPDWEDEALARWRGNVRTAVHGINRLNLAISDPNNPHMIIEPGYDTDTVNDRASKLYYDAEMAINVVNGHGFDADGNEVDVLGVLGFDVLYDQREEKYMLVVEIDVSRLPELDGFPAAGQPAALYVGSFEPGNGIPDWEIADHGASQEALDEFQAWIESVFGDAPPLRVSNAVGHVENAWDACMDENSSQAAAQINAAGNQLDSAAHKSHKEITTAQAEELKGIIAALGTCDGFFSDIADWPPEWAAYPKPYESSTTEYAVKLHSGATLAQPLTVVTANPAYVRGDYNSVDKKPAAVIADAVTILSNAWSDDDLTHSQKPLSQRIASNTTQNMALMLGNTTTQLGSYNGGVENLPRFLERWSGRTFTYRGSLIDLWTSQNATGAWGKGNVYSPPARDWEFDTDLLDPANLPPSTPEVYTVRMRSWMRR